MSAQTKGNRLVSYARRGHPKIQRRDWTPFPADQSYRTPTCHAWCPVAGRCADGSTPWLALAGPTGLGSRTLSLRQHGFSWLEELDSMPCFSEIIGSMGFTFRIHRLVPNTEPQNAHSNRHGLCSPGNEEYPILPTVQRECRFRNEESSSKAVFDMSLTSIKL